MIYGNSDCRLTPANKKHYSSTWKLKTQLQRAIVDAVLGDINYVNYKNKCGLEVLAFTPAVFPAHNSPHFGFDGKVVCLLPVDKWRLPKSASIDLPPRFLKGAIPGLNVVWFMPVFAHESMLPISAHHFIMELVAAAAVVRTPLVTHELKHHFNQL